MYEPALTRQAVRAVSNRSSSKASASAICQKTGSDVLGESAAVSPLSPLDAVGHDDGLCRRRFGGARLRLVVGHGRPAMLGGIGCSPAAGVAPAAA
jgi:hypothetical protein